MKSRTEVPKEDRWNPEAIYPDLAHWEEAFKEMKPNGPLDVSRLLRYKGRLGETPEVLKLALEEFLSLERKLTRLYMYAHLKHDEDIAENSYKKALGEIQSAIFELQREAAWFEPELIDLSEDTQKIYLASAPLKDFQFFLEKIFRMKKHTLSAEKEELFSLALKAMQTPGKAFSAMNDADLTFPNVLDSEKKEHELTHASYQVLMRSQDRTLRENTFKTILKSYSSFDNTMAELIQGAVQRNIFAAKSHYYSSALEAALFPKNIPTEVYKALISAVRENIDALHDYYKLRAKALHLEPLHLWDERVPLTPHLDIKIGYKEAENTILESLSPLGEDYVRFLKKGFQEERWVDRYENKNKRSGAYSSGSYDSMPYILMNYKDILRDVFTLTHEAGHSMHSAISHTSQPYQYGDYPIFLAEVASTFNEELLFGLAQKAKSKEEKIFLINQKIEDIRGTLFRQTMFAEFELMVHELAENEVTLTPQLLKEEYFKLNEIYFGDNSS